MNRPVIIKPDIPINNWYDSRSTTTIEDQIVNAILAQIGDDNRRLFFESSLKDIPNPSQLKNIDEALELLISAIDGNKKILIVGDYDVDGITSTALLIRFFKKIGLENFEWFIPNRFVHGYGLTEASVEVVLERNPDLVITVDSGITAKKEIERIKSADIGVIVTDHHLPQEEFLPQCAVINPKQEDCAYPFKELSGVGVAFLLLIALRAALREKKFWVSSEEEPNLLEHLDLVALGTIADQVPLLGVNRLFAKFGLSQMTKQIQNGYPDPFFLYLKIFSKKNGIKIFNSESIAFSLAPLLNATGRMKDAEEGLNFLLSDDEQTAASRYQYLERLNQKRRRKQQSMSQKAVEMAEDLINGGKGIVVYNETFHEGLIGVIASRLVDQFYFPSVVLTDGESGVLKASCRSKNENIMEILQRCDEYLLQFGGHANAAGCSLKKENLEAFHKKYTEVCNEFIPQDETYQVKATIEVDLEMMTYQLIEKLKVLEPYGHKNRKPIFFCPKINLPIPTTMTGKHLKWQISRDLELIHWNGAGMVDHAEKYDVTFTLGENFYRGERKRQLIVQTILSAD